MQYLRLVLQWGVLVAGLIIHSYSYAEQSSALSILKVYKTPTCGCCGKWLKHLEEQRVFHQAIDVTDLSSIKKQLKILPRYQSCHTGVSEHGYVFEGHVPAKYIKQFLNAPVEGAIGLSVPAMPLGSPGMEVGKRFHPYQVLLLMPDGSHSVFAEVKRYEEQF
ncbi:DUF411 domain-containing protein [Pseudoalteromonas luteoviolacea]|uniref:Metal-binding protein n=1 Tax=Pseudoalteromonas luteoviolacea S4060-1 TaxID=1365257 RepID=A0A161YVP5_9GAMM|nr:DUF411 domain-containing protein [Pseudoalteromonas luteoviolacea]KZN66792.1 hypothetical protein N478_18315 [Pseudoalteromonas luteoviolacea S4060-1]